LTYEKKGFWGKCFAEQTLNEIIKILYGFTERNFTKSDTELYRELLTTKKNLSDEIRQREIQLKAGQTYFQSIAAIFILAVTQHPEYQIGRLSARFADYSGEHSKIPILREKLSTSLKNKLEHATGTSFLGISLLIARRIGYSYHLIMTLNRIPLSQINALFYIGFLCDTVSQYIGLPVLNSIEKRTLMRFVGLLERLKRAIRSDELGVIEKELIIQWMSGLGIHLALTGGQAVIPATLGYTVATICRETAGSITDKTLK